MSRRDCAAAQPPRTSGMSGVPNSPTSTGGAAGGGSAATTYPRWARHLDPALRRCSNCQGHGSVGSWHQPIKCGVCDEGFVPVDSPFASGTSTACPTCGKAA